MCLIRKGMFNKITDWIFVPFQVVYAMLKSPMNQNIVCNISFEIAMISKDYEKLGEIFRILISQVQLL